MRYTDYLYTLLIRGESQKHVRGFTMFELLIALAILGTLSGIAVPVYRNQTDERNLSAAIVGIQKIALGIESFRAERGRPPDSLAEAGLPTQLDPWGRPYQYTRLEGLSKDDMEAKCQWNKQNKPLNHDFDLFSMGKDGVTEKNGRIDHPKCYDDIIRANAGFYVGPSSEY